MNKFCMLVVMVFWAEVVWPLCSAGETIALISGSGERAPDGVVIAELESSMLADPALTIVEREHIRKILAEQVLATGDYASRVQWVNLGKIISAEVLVFVDKVPRSTPVVSLIRAIDSRTGICLDSWVVQDLEARAEVGRLSGKLKIALSKGRLPQGKRQAVGLLEFRSEESGLSLESLADGMGELLMAELGRAPAVLVLDREHLSQLRDEKGLTIMGQELKTSTWMLEAGLKRAGSNGELDVTLVVRPLVGSATLSQVVRVNRGDMLVASRELAAVAAKLMQTELSASVADGTAKDEAATDVRLREELLILEEKVFRFQLEYYKQHYSQFGEEYWWAWACRLGNRSSSRLPVPSNLKAFAPGQPERQIKLIREAVDAFVNPPDRPNWYPVSRLMTLLVIPEQLRPMFAGEKPDYRVLYDAESEAKFCEYLQELSKHKDPIVRFMAHDGLDNLYSYSQRKEKEYFLNRMRMHPVFLRV